MEQARRAGGGGRRRLRRRWRGRPGRAAWGQAGGEEPRAGRGTPELLGESVRGEGGRAAGRWFPSRTHAHAPGPVTGALRGRKGPAPAGLGCPGVLRGRREAPGVSAWAPGVFRLSPLSASGLASGFPAQRG